MTDMDPKALDAYFERIGYDGERTPTLKTLSEIHWRHALSIPFENLDPLLQRPVRLDLESLLQKLVVERRGGYCYEQNTLLRHVLTALGFQSTGHSARVVWAVPEGMSQPRTHMLLRIAIEGVWYLADVGFGSFTLTTPLLMEPGLEQTTTHEDFRLTPVPDDGGTLLVEANAGGAWRALYRFDLQPQQLEDYEMCSWYLCTNPKSHFLRTLMVARVTPEGRYALRNNRVSIHHTGGPSERKFLTSSAELRAVLSGPLGIQLPDSPGLEPVLERFAAEPPEG